MGSRATFVLQSQIEERQAPGGCHFPNYRCQCTRGACWQVVGAFGLVITIQSRSCTEKSRHRETSDGILWLSVAGHHNAFHLDTGLRRSLGSNESINPARSSTKMAAVQLTSVCWICWLPSLMPSRCLIFILCLHIHLNLYSQFAFH